jgi:long-chain fatty acid transport protein
MRRFAVLLLAGLPAVVAAQGFGVYEHNACAMARAGVTAAAPCADGSAIYFNPAGLGALGGNRLSAGVTFIGAQGGFTDDILGTRTNLDNPLIPVPNLYLTHALSPQLTAGIGVYAPYGLETKWPTEGFMGRFLGYNTDIRSIYIQPTLGYEVTPKLKLGLGVAYITSRLELHQRADLSAQIVPPALAALLPGLPAGTRFAALGIPTGTDFADAELEATGSGFAVNFGAIIKLSDRFSIGGHWLTRRTIAYSGSATFDSVPTGLALPVTLGTCPACVPAGTPVDALLAAQFAPGGNLADGTVKTSITMPPQGTIGFAYRATDDWAVMMDYQYTVWGWFSNILIDFANPGTPDLTLNPSSKDTHGFRFGTEYQFNPKIQLRGGYLYHTAASPPEFITPLLPEGARNEFTVGAGINLTPKLHADLAYQYIRQNKRRGLVVQGGGNVGLYDFSAHLFGIGAAYTF